MRDVAHLGQSVTGIVRDVASGAVAMTGQGSRQDRNFDDLAEQFSRRVYGGTKGWIRLQLLERDLREGLPALYDPQAPRVRILDAGGGEGQFSRTLARLGHRVELWDLSAEMVRRAQAQVEAERLGALMQCRQGAVQDLPAAAYDLVLFHAVLEWVSDPRAVLQQVMEQVRVGGTLSVMFYNRHSTIFRSVLRGFLQKILDGDIRGKGKGLTPISPLEPDDVLGWLQTAGFQIQVRSGIRVFHDYLHHDIRHKVDEQALLALETDYSRREPYRALARYYHVVAHRKES